MNPSPLPYSTVTGWRPGKRFWITHFWLPLVIAGASVFVLQHSNLDLWLADGWYELGGYQWAWRHGWVSYDPIHHHGKQGIIAFGILLVGLIISSYFLPRLRLWRLPMTYLITTMTLVPGVIAVLKTLNTAPCP